MFGYVMIDKPELKIKEFDRYRSYYCGLCEALKRRHGLVGRAMLTYDMAFLEMLLSDLYDIGDGEEAVEDRRCIVHPLHRHCQRYSVVSEYCADMTILLAYQKCLDDWQDEHRPGRWIWSKLLKRHYEEVREREPERVAAVESRLQRLHIVENAKDTPMDKVAKLFGEIMAIVFVWKDDFWKDDLYRVGFFLGKYIYLLDAYEDLEKDRKSGAYNPFLGLPETEGPEFEAQVLQLLTMMMGECTEAFERLPLVENMSILRNILYSGVWVRYERAREMREGKKEGKAEEKTRVGAPDMTGGRTDETTEEKMGGRAEEKMPGAADSRAEEKMPSAADSRAGEVAEEKVGGRTGETVPGAADSRAGEVAEEKVGGRTGETVPGAADGRTAKKTDGRTEEKS